MEKIFADQCVIDLKKFKKDTFELTGDQLISIISYSVMYRDSMMGEFDDLGFEIGRIYSAIGETLAIGKNSLKGEKLIINPNNFNISIF